MKVLLGLSVGTILISTALANAGSEITLTYGERVSTLRFATKGDGYQVEFRNNNGKSGQKNFIGADASFIRNALQKIERSLPWQEGFCSRQEISFNPTGSKAVTKRACLNPGGKPQLEATSFIDLLSTYF